VATKSIRCNKIREPETLHYTEYGWPNNEARTFNARGVFLDVVQQVAPRVLRCLAGAPYASFLSMADKMGGARLAEEFLEPALTDQSEDMQQFLSMSFPLHEWAHRYGIEVPWIEYSALRTLYIWALRHESATRPNSARHALDDLSPQRDYDPSTDSGRQWAPQMISIELPFRDQEAFSHDLVLPLYRPWATTKAKARKDMEKVFADYLTGYLDSGDRIPGYLKRAEDQCKKAGMVPMKKERQPEHYYWLVQYQVLSVPIGKIVDAELAARALKKKAKDDAAVPTETDELGGVVARVNRAAARNERDQTRDSILAAIHRKAKFIGLPVKKLPVGRPTGARNVIPT
jgi:hypothetical protein